MRRTLKIGIGAGTAAIIATMSAGVASATTGGLQAAGSAATMTSVNKHITRAQARHLARAAVPHSRVIEVQSDDLHDHPVWKVQLATRHGRVVVDVSKRTGKVTILRRHGGGGGHDDAVLATPAGPSSVASVVASMSRQVTDDRGRDARDNDGAREERGDRHDDGRGDRHDHDRGDRDGHDHDHGDDGSGR
jgi:Peptidase propeptide and YPEB domain